MTELYRLIIAVFIFVTVGGVHAQTFNPMELHREISELNDRHQYEASILRLEEIISSSASTSYDKYHAYLQKSLTYKRLYNYSGALSNLDLALKQAAVSQHREEAEMRVLVEQLFVYFDLQKEQEFDRLFKMVNQEKLHLLDEETQATFVTILGIRAMRDKEYENADRYLDRAIALIKDHNPKHLPNIYRVKVALYGEINAPEKVIEAYERGMSYANKYHMDIYIIIMEETITRYYESKKDYEHALYAQKRVSKARTKYDANNQAGKLNILENELLQQRQGLELSSERNFRYYLISLAVVLALLLITLWKLHKTSVQKRVLVENENARMRITLQNMTQGLNEQGESKAKLENHVLTKRQREIIELVNQDKTNKEIGVALHISENTVKYHLKLIYEILEIDSRSELKSNFVFQ